MITPGTWKTQLYHQRLFVQDEDGIEIAEITRRGQDREAYACLISACPELLESLAMLLRGYEIALDGEDWHKRDQQLIAQCQAAIDKAKGQQP